MESDGRCHGSSEDHCIVLVISGGGGGVRWRMRGKAAHQLLVRRLVELRLHGKIRERLPGRLVGSHLHGVGVKVLLVTHGRAGHHWHAAHRPLQLAVLKDRERKGSVSMLLDTEKCCMLLDTEKTDCV